MMSKSGCCVGAVSLLVATFSAQGQAISSFDPQLGWAHDQVTITGSGFYPGTLVVRFNGTVDPTAMATAANGTLITPTVPMGSASGTIHVPIIRRSPPSHPHVLPQ